MEQLLTRWSLRRCFALIDSSTLEQTRDETETDAQTHLDSLVELGLSSTVSTVLTQCSVDIYKVPLPVHPQRVWHPLVDLSLNKRPRPSPLCLFQVALQKVFGFATSSVFETCVCGRMVADVCRAAAKVAAGGYAKALTLTCSSCRFLSAVSSRRGSAPVCPSLLHRGFPPRPWSVPPPALWSSTQACLTFDLQVWLKL